MSSQYSLIATPDNFFDGGYGVVIGAGSIPSAKANYEAAINSCGARTPWDIDMTLTAEWGTGADMQIDLTVTNNAASQYNGYVRVFIVEKVATIASWGDGTGNPYTMAFLDFAVNTAVSINAGVTQPWSVVWDGALNGDGYGNTFDFITPDNIMVIAAAYEGTAYPKYSYPPNQGPFNAYYLDESIGVEPTGEFPDIEIVSFTAPTQADPGENVYGQVDLTLGNDGVADASSFYVSVYISEDDVITTDDHLLVDGRVFVAGVPIGGIVNVPFPSTLAIPSGLDIGEYYCGLLVDDDRDVHEVDETNNMLAYEIEIGHIPVPDIKVNGSDGPLSLHVSENVEVTIGLDPGDLDGKRSDWWLYVTRNGSTTWWAKYTAGQRPTWTKSLYSSPFATVKLRYVGSYKVFPPKNPRGIPQGSWVWTFSVDDGWDLIKDDMYMDQVELTVYP